MGHGERAWMPSRPVESTGSHLMPLADTDGSIEMAEGIGASPTDLASFTLLSPALGLASHSDLGNVGGFAPGCKGSDVAAS